MLAIFQLRAAVNKKLQSENVFIDWIKILRLSINSHAKTIVILDIAWTER